MIGSDRRKDRTTSVSVKLPPRVGGRLTPVGASRASRRQVYFERPFPNVKLYSLNEPV